MQDDLSNKERAQQEVELLRAMYPEQVTYDEHGQELIYKNNKSRLRLRLPDSYPDKSLPEILEAVNTEKLDISDALRERVRDLPLDEEALDAIVASFNEITEPSTSESNGQEHPTEHDAETPHEPPRPNKNSKTTIIIWLHHLLNTSKRKQSLAPDKPSISGISKPGYPGVLVFSGPSNDVHEHVNELKQLNWQAFQIRTEEEEEWIFSHGEGVVEVESMKDVVREVGEGKKGLFMDAMRMK